MSGVVQSIRNQTATNPRLLPAIDQLLIAGIKLGPNKKREAINKILQLVPGWRRGDCWRRIRQLRRTQALAPLGTGTCADNTKDAPNHHASSRPWLSEDDAALLDLAGYEPVKRIAERLNRSERAVRFRLGALGISAKVIDGWSQRALRKLLCMSRTRLRQLVAERVLRVRDSRITGNSLALFSEKRRSLDSASTPPKLVSYRLSATPCSWKRTAKVLHLPLSDVQRLIAAGELRLVDTFVTDSAFAEFCKSHGSVINMGLIDRSTRKWLVSEYGVPDCAEEKNLPRAQKHALVIRACKCGRKISGNVYFRHVRHCPMSADAGVRAA